MTSLLNPDLELEFRKLKTSSGSHAPGVSTLRNQFDGLNSIIDSCFISHPEATELFLNNFKHAALQEGFLKHVIQDYPAQGASLAEILSPYLGVSARKIFVCNGAIEAIQSILNNFSRNTLVSLPNFTAYHEFAARYGNVYFNYLKPENNFKIDVDQILDRVKEYNIDTVIVINPNNPDGGYTSQSKLAYLCEHLPESTLMIVDESFIHFAWEKDINSIPSILPWTEKYPNLVVIKSLAKDYGVAGLRVGVAVMEESMTSQLNQYGHLWNINGLAEYFLRLMVTEDFQNKYEPLRLNAIQNVQQFIEEFKTIDSLKIFPSKANFVLAQLPPQISSERMMLKLLFENGIYVRDCSDKPGLDESYIRIASRTSEENERIVGSLRKVLNEI